MIPAALQAQGGPSAALADAEELSTVEEHFTRTNAIEADQSRPFCADHRVVVDGHRLGHAGAMARCSEPLAQPHHWCVDILGPARSTAGDDHVEPGDLGRSEEDRATATPSPNDVDAAPRAFVNVDHRWVTLSRTEHKCRASDMVHPDLGGRVVGNRSGVKASCWLAEVEPLEHGLSMPFRKPSTGTAAKCRASSSPTRRSTTLSGVLDTVERVPFRPPLASGHVSCGCTEYTLLRRSPRCADRPWSEGKRGRSSRRDHRSIGSGVHPGRKFRGATSTSA